MHAVVQAVANFFDQHSLFGTYGVVAVSGGADSVALLRALVELGRFQLRVAHVNHQLRGAESDADEAFVRDLAEQLKLPFDTAQRPVATDTAIKANARTARYAWLEDILHTHGDHWLATAHTECDQVETMLHRLIRGTGLGGLDGIAAQRCLKNKRWLVRPLLRVTHAQNLDYLNQLKQSQREDASNADDRFTRNRIRHELVPLLQTFNPAVSQALLQFRELALEAQGAIEMEAQTLLENVERPRVGTTVILNVKALSRFTQSLSAAVEATTDPLEVADRLDFASFEHPHIIREMFRLIWRREGWPRAGMTFLRWDELAGTAMGTVTAVDLPGGLRAERARDIVRVGPVNMRR